MNDRLAAGSWTAKMVWPSTRYLTSVSAQCVAGVRTAGVHVTAVAAFAIAKRNQRWEREGSITTSGDPWRVEGDGPYARVRWNGTPRPTTAESTMAIWGANGVAASHLRNLLF